MRQTAFVRQRIINLKLSQRGISNSEVSRKLLAEDGVKCSRQNVGNIFKRYQETGLTTPGFGGGKRLVLEVRHLDFIDLELTNNTELTAADLQAKLHEEFGLVLSRETVQRARKRLGWKYTGTRYCQLISQKNKQERLAFAVKCLHNRDLFQDVIFTDETKILMEVHTKRQCRKEGMTVSQRARAVAKHPYQIYAWGGISCRGATDLFCFANGTMDSTYYQGILSNHYIPFAQNNYPEGCRLWQDNDPKHVSRATKAFMADKGINWWPTPAQSPDLNPIELVWHQVKHHLRKHVKPTTKEQLTRGIQEAWAMITPNLCQRYIRHLQKVLPLVVLRKGAASGY